MKSEEYELLTREIFQHLLDQDLVPNIAVEHDVIKRGLKTSHQIDVYWEFELGGIKYRTVVQAKNWAKAVDQGELLKFEAVLRDLPGQPRGIIVTANGCQEGAIEIAIKCGIKIYELKEDTPPPLELNYTGWCTFKPLRYRTTATGPFALMMDVEIVTPSFSNLNFNADSKWHRDNKKDIPSMSGVKFLPHEVEFYNGDKRPLRTLRDIYQDIAKKVGNRDGITTTETYSFDGPTFLKAPSISSFIKIIGFSVDITLKIERQERVWRVRNVALFILKSLDDEKTRHFVKFPEH